MPPESSAPAEHLEPSPNAVGFSLSFVEGKGVLGLGPRRLGALLTCERLELEIPGLTFPFDVSGGAGRFQSRRCAVRQARLTLDEGPLAAHLARDPRVAAAGFGGLEARLRDGGVELAGRVRLGDAAAELTARGYLVPEGARGLRLALGEVRLFGALPVAAVVVGRRLLEALAAGLAGARLAGAADLVLDPLDEVLFALLPPCGWRLPDAAGAALTDARIEGGRLELVYGHGPAWAAAPPPRFRAHHAAALRFAALEEQLGAAPPWEAQAGYRAALAEHGDDPLLVERLLDLLAAATNGGATDAADATLAAAARALAAAPALAAAHLAQAAVLLQRGQPEGAAIVFATVAEQAAAAGDETDMVGAARVAARLFREAAPERAVPLLERVLAARPDDAEAAALLAACYEAAGRHEDLAALLRCLIRAMPAGPAQAPLLRELAAVLRGPAHDPAGAAAALARAAELMPADAALWEALADAADAAGDGAQAAAALVEAGALLAAAGQGEREAEVQARRAAVAERLGLLSEAAAAYARILTLRPDDAATWRRAAAVAERSWRPADAIAALRRHLDLCDGEEDQRRALRDLARLTLAEGDLHGAAAALERALALMPHDLDALRLLVEVAAARNNPADLDAALARAASAADGAARAELLRRRAEVLWGGPARAADAWGARAHAAAAAPAAAAPALRALAELQGRRGDEEAVRDALTRLLPLAGDAPDFAELCTRAGELAGRAGDRAAAQALLRTAADRAPDPRPALAALEEVLTRDGDLAGRAAVLERRVAVEEQRGETAAIAAARRAHADALTALGRHADAVFALGRALDLAPGDLPTVRALADAHVAAGRLQAAEPLYERWLAAAGEAPPAAHAAVALRLGELLAQQGRDRDAVERFRAALASGARGESAARCWRRIVDSLQRSGQHEAAAVALAAAAEDPATGEGPRERATHLAFAAETWRRRAGDPARARACLERAVALAPDFLPALDGLEALETADGTPASIAAILERKIAASGRLPERAKALLVRLAELRAGPLAQPDEARAAMARALELDPAFRPALLWLARDAALRGDRAAAEAHYRAIIAQPVAPDDDPRRRDELTEGLARLAAISRESDRVAEAERLCGRALDAQPRCLPALALLDEILGDQGRHAEQCELLRRHAALLLEGAETGAVERALELELRRARLLEEELSRPKEAAAAYRHVLRLSPNHRHALERLAAILRAGGDGRELYACVGKLAELGPAEAAGALHLELAALAREELRDLPAAERHARRALALVPRSGAALDALLGLLRARGDAAALEELLVRRLQVEDDPARAAALTLERARLLAGLGRGAEALAVLRELSADAAPDEALRLRADLCEAGGAHAEAAEQLEVLRGRSRGRGDAPTELGVVRRLAALADGLGHDRAAEELYRRCLELAPTDEDVARALGEVYRRTRDGRRYVEMQERILGAARRRQAAPAEQLELLLTIARVLLSAGEARGARTRLDEAVRLAPADRRVRRLRAEAAAAFGEFATVRDELRALAGDEGLEAGERADIAVELADVCRDRLGDAPAALAALEQAADLYPPGLRRQSTLRLLAERAYAAADFARAAAGYRALEARAPEDQARLAECLERLGRTDEAAALWRELEEVAPLRARARARLMAIYRAAGQEHELAAALERAAADETEAADPRGRAAALDEAAALHLAAGDHAAAARCAAAALGADPGPVDLEPLLRAVGESVTEAAAQLAALAASVAPPRRAALHAALAAAAERLGDPAAAARAIEAALGDEAAPRRRAALLRERGRLERDALGDAAAAALSFEAVLAIDPDDAAALAAAADLAERRADLARAGDLLARLLARAAPPERRGLLDRMSRVALRRGDETAFARHLEAILELAPGDERALAALAALRRAQGDGRGAADLYGRLAERAHTAPRRAELLAARGALLDDAGDLDGAREALAQAVAEHPDPGLLGRLVDLAARGEHVGEAAAACARLVEVLPAGAARGEALGRLGALRLRLEDRAGAREAYRQAAQELGSGAGWAAALRAVAELARGAEEAAAALRAVCGTGEATEEDRARLAALDAATAPPSPEPAPQLEPAPPPEPPPPPLLPPEPPPLLPPEPPPEPGPQPVPLLQPEAQPQPEPQALPQMESAVVRTVRALDEETRPQATVVSLRRRIEAAAERGDDADLLACCRELWARRPGDALAFAHLRRLATVRGAADELLAVLAGRIDTSDRPGERAALRCELGFLLEERQADVDTITAIYEAALADDPGSVPALDGLADLCYRRHELARARDLYALLGDRGTRLPPDALACRRGELSEAAGDHADAQLLYLAAAEANPAQLEAREALARLALLSGDRGAAIEWLRQVERLLPLTETERRVEVRRQLAELHVRAGEPGVARIYLELVLAEEQDCAPALELGAAVYAQLSEWERAAGCLERLGFLVADPQMRAELLFRRGEIYRRRLGDPARASDCYLRAIDLAPQHVPTLRRVVDHYWSAGEWQGVVEVGGELSQLGPPLADSAAFAMRYALGTVLATRDLATAAGRLGRVALDAEALREHLVHAARCLARGGGAVELLDGPLGLFAAAGGDRVTDTLAEELGHYLRAHPADAACRRLLARLCEQRGAAARARSHYAVCAFLDPADPAAARLAALGPAPAASAEELQRGAAVHPEMRGPLRRVLGALAPSLAGLAPESLRPPGPPVEPATAPLPFAHVEQLRVALAIGALTAHWLPDEPLVVAAESTRPPRLLVSRAAAALPAAEFGFLVARALDLLRSGGALCARLTDDDVLALLSALAAQLGASEPLTTAAARGFADRLAGLGVRIDGTPEPLRSQVAADLRACLAVPLDLESIRRGQRRSAERLGLLAGGDLLGALRALTRLETAPPDDSPAGRAALLERSPALAALVEFATSAEYATALTAGGG